MLCTLDEMLIFKFKILSKTTGIGKLGTKQKQQC